MLLALAAWVGAVGLVRLSALYASFMSGDTAHVAAAPAAGDWHAMAGRANSSAPSPGDGTALSS